MRATREHAKAAISRRLAAAAGRMRRGIVVPTVSAMRTIAAFHDDSDAAIERELVRLVADLRPRLRARGSATLAG